MARLKQVLRTEKVEYVTPMGVVTLRYRTRDGHWRVTLRYEGKTVYSQNYYDALGTLIEVVKGFLQDNVEGKLYWKLIEPFELASIIGGYVYGRKPKLPPPNIKELQ